MSAPRLRKTVNVQQELDRKVRTAMFGSGAMSKPQLQTALMHMERDTEFPKSVRAEVIKRYRDLIAAAPSAKKKAAKSKKPDALEAG